MAASEATSAYSKGSEWRKWDLHVHTPYSVLNNGFGQDFEQYAATLLKRAAQAGIAAIGLTDYFLLDGYSAMRALIADEDRLSRLLEEELIDAARAIAFLPNIELRSTVVVTDGKAGRVNFHLIFDPDLEPKTIEEHFLRELKFTAEADPSNPDERWSVTQENLKELGARLKADHTEFASQPDLVVGMMNAVISHEEVTAVLDRQSSRFEGKYLFVVAADEDLSELSWDGQAHQTRKLFIQKSHMLFSANPGTREFGLGRRHPSPDDFRAEFQSLKPCIHGSDAHSFRTLFDPANSRQLWIKADLTFQGLRQLLFEPESRVFIGTEPTPLSKKRERATRYMERIAFHRTPKAKDEAQWFHGSIPLNHGLVAIIGNKGSGKSALSDMLTLLGDTRNTQFSFLTPNRFLAPRTGFGEMFNVEVQWLSGQSRSRDLSDPADSTSPELVKYIPQGFLEEICSELQESHQTKFDLELMDVIFSHVGTANRLGKDSLPKLIGFLTEETEELIDQLRQRLAEINRELLSLQEHQTDEYRQTLQAQLTQRLADRDAHLAAKPPEVKEPLVNAVEQGAPSSAKIDLDASVREIEELDAEIAQANETLAAAALQIASADRLLDRLANLERLLETFHAESTTDAEALGIDTRRLLSVVIDRAALYRARDEAATLQRDTQALLSADEGSLQSRRTAAEKRAETARSSLDEQSRQHEEHLRRLAGWEKRLREIEGTPTATNSIKWLEARIEDLKELPSLIEEKRSERIKVVGDIYEAKERLLGKYRALYAPVQDFIDNHEVAQQHSTLQFSASIAVEGFGSSFLNMIHHGRRGSFQGEAEGREVLRRLLAKSDFSTVEGVTAFLEDVERHLTTDLRDGGGGSVSVADQLRQGWTPKDVYDYLYGLDYLVPRFALLWQGKPIDQLSPGERGNLLLLFYLLIDKRDVPLIIDQPEENLDNHTIATALIPALRYAKERRQVVIVTHNPNLAVVCDAEQIVHAQIDKMDGNRVDYTSGGIEDPVITRLVVDILEGTKPAFDIRDSKYEVLERLSAE